jgi:hypothetical protein
LRQISYAEKQIISYFRIFGTIPSTVKDWNKHDIAIRKLDSLSKFKNAIRLNSQSNKNRLDLSMNRKTESKIKQLAA